VKRTSILALLVSAMLYISLLGCGTPARGNLQTVTLTASKSEVKGEGGTLQLTAMGNFTKENDDVTTTATYAVTPKGTDLSGQLLLSPPQTITVSTTGLVTAVPPFVCSFHNAGTATTPAYVLEGSYQIVATFRGVASQPVFVGVASAAGDGPSGACGP
jgi:hypothetical protein